jgi:hypothetical protein
MRPAFKVLPFRYPSDHELAGQQDYFRLALDEPPARWPWLVAVVLVVLLGVGAAYVYTTRADGRAPQARHRN